METYLPAGADWYDFWTNERLAGGQTVQQALPARHPPALRPRRLDRADGPGRAVRHRAARCALRDPHLSRARTRKFTIYEDDNETYAYEKGQRATYDLVWNEAATHSDRGRTPGLIPGPGRQT